MSRVITLPLIGRTLLQFSSCDKQALPNGAQNDQWLVGAYFYLWYGDPKDAGLH